MPSLLDTDPTMGYDPVAAMQQARSMGLLSAGLGILGNNYGHYGQFGPAIGGAQQGINTYQGLLASGPEIALKNMQLQQAAMQMQLLRARIAANQKLLSRVQGNGSISASGPQGNTNAGSAAPSFMTGGDNSSTMPGTPAPSTPSMSMSPATGQDDPLMGIPPALAERLLSNDMTGEEFDKAAVQYNIPTDTMKNIRMLPVTDRTAALYRVLFPAVRQGEYITGPNGMSQLPEAAAGTVNVPDGRGGFINRQVPNAISNIAATEGAKSRATEDQKVRDVTLSDGSVVPMRTADAVNRTAPSSTGGGNTAPTSAGIYADVPRSESQSGMGQSTLDAELSKKRAADVSQYESELTTKANASRMEIAANVHMMKNLEQGMSTGPLAKQLTYVRNLLQQLGVEVKDPTGNYTFDKNAIASALQNARAIYGPRLTNMDVQTQLLSNPNATMPEKAIYELLQIRNAANSDDLRKLQVYNKYKTISGVDRTPQAFEGWYNSKFPNSANITGPSIDEAPGYNPTLRNGKQTGSQSSFDDLPNAGGYAGKIILDSKTMKRYQSDGKKWVQVK